VRRFIADMNPTLRGFIIIALIAGVVVVLQLYQTLVALSILARIAFLLAVAFFVYLVWRERRGEISEWPARARTAFYGAAILVVVDIGVFTFVGASGLDAVAFILVLGLCAYAMWRTWRQEHTYS
jgi:small-conductance mechanosensitive channel